MKYYVKVQFKKGSSWSEYSFHDDATLIISATTLTIKDNGKILFVGDIEDYDYSLVDVNGTQMTQMIMNNTMSETLKALYPESKSISQAAIVMEDSAVELWNELNESQEGVYFSLVEQKFENKKEPDAPQQESKSNWWIWLVAGVAVIGVASYGKTKSKVRRRK